jgi:hypothetical protein
MTMNFTSAPTSVFRTARKLVIWFEGLVEPALPGRLGAAPLRNVNAHPPRKASRK